MSVTDKHTRLNTMPHYSDERFRHPQTVFGAEHKGLQYDYSDRIQQWNYDKADAAREKAKASGLVERSAAYYELYLSEYFDRPVEVGHILAGWNVSTGYPYAVFGYRFKDEQ